MIGYGVKTLTHRFIVPQVAGCCLQAMWVLCPALAGKVRMHVHIRRPRRQGGGRRLALRLLLKVGLYLPRLTHRVRGPQVKGVLGACCCAAACTRISHMAGTL